MFEVIAQVNIWISNPNSSDTTEVRAFFSSFVSFEQYRRPTTVKAGEISKPLLQYHHPNVINGPFILSYFLQKDIHQRYIIFSEIPDIWP